MNTPKQATPAGVLATLATLIGTIVGAVWSARNHAEAQVQRLEDTFRSAMERHEVLPHRNTMSIEAHDRDIDKIMERLERIETKIDKILFSDSSR